MNDGDFDFSDFEDDFCPPPEPIAPETPDPSDNLPVSIDNIDLLQPPGFVGSVANWIDAQCRYPRRRLAVISAIVSIGNIAGLRFVDGRDGVTANMLAFCVSASATGKEAVQQAAADLHKAAGVHYALQGGIKSEQEIMRNLLDNQAAYYIVDEIGIFLSKIRNAQRRGGAAYLEGVFGAIMSAYSKANSRLLLQGDTKRELRKIYTSQLSRAMDDDDDRAQDSAERMLRMVDEGLDKPFLSVIGYTTPSTFEGSMDGETATQGFVGRALIVNEPEINPSPRKGFKASEIPLGMAMRLSTLYGHEPTARVEHTGTRSIITTTPGADEMLDAIIDWLIDYADEVGEHAGEAAVAMIRRAYEMIAKVSFILAIPHGERTEEHVRWAFAYVRKEVDQKVHLVFANDNAKSRPEDALAARALNYIPDDSPISLGVLSNRLKIGQQPLRDVIERLEAGGFVKRENVGRKYRGKVVEYWLRVK